MMCCTANSWRQLFSPQPFIEKGQRRRGSGESCKCDVWESSMYGCKAEGGS